MSEIWQEGNEKHRPGEDRKISKRKEKKYKEEKQKSGKQ